VVQADAAAILSAETAGQMSFLLHRAHSLTEVETHQGRKHFMNLFKLKTAIVLIVLLALAAAEQTPGQRTASRTFVNGYSRYNVDTRPFDFSDKYYETNGVLPTAIEKRHSGSDGRSASDATYDQRFRNVRILETFPAYGPNGEMLFWNRYGDVGKYAFTTDDAGRAAVYTAHYYPVYMFPSATAKYADRQAALIETDDHYAQKNALGIGVVILVEYTDAADTEEGKALLAELGKKNGLSLDGTPIIRSVRELGTLTRSGVVRQSVRGSSDPYPISFVIGKVIANPTGGTISNDAYLEFVRQPNGEPLAAEEFFISNFECLRKFGRLCGVN
jgi:hypothetical protein